MRKVSEEFHQIVSTGNVVSFRMLEVLFPVPIRQTTHPFDITFNGNTFEARDDITGLSAPKVSDTVDREVFSIKLFDGDKLWRERVKGGVTGTRVNIWLGLMNTTNDYLDTVAPGSPLLRNEQDLVKVYSGFIDGVLSDSGGEDTLTIQCSSPMSDLDLVRSLMTAPYAVKNFNPLDLCFDNIHTDYDALNLLWGKKKE